MVIYLAKLDIVIEELTIFETLNSFDERAANWKCIQGSGIEYCKVLAYVPNQALSPTENSYSSIHYAEVRKKEFEFCVWKNHCFAIWQYHEGISWDEACMMLEKHRDEGKPIGMKIFKNESLEWFEATQVVKYL